MSSVRRSAEKAQEKQQPTTSGRSCKEQQDDGAPQGAGADAEESVECIHEFTDREFRKIFPLVFEGLAAKAAQGCVQHIRLLLQIGKFDDPKAKRRDSAMSLSTMLLDELKRRQDEREAAAEKVDDASVVLVEAKQSGSTGESNDGIAAND